MIGYGSAAVNDQLVPVPVQAAYNPLMFGAAYTGPSWPRNGIYNVPPVITPGINSSGYAGGAGVAPATPTNSTPTATDANGNPYSLTKSPVIWAIAFLIIALVLLHKVHW